MIGRVPALTVPRRILVVKLADLGDLLTATPAIRALRESFAAAHVAALVTPDSAQLLCGATSVDAVHTFDKSAFDSPVQAFLALPSALRLHRQLRAERFDTVVLLHHLTTVWGTAKYAALALSTGAAVRAGLDNGRGQFLTHRAVDLGFGARHEVDYWLDVAASLGARNRAPQLEVPVDDNSEARAEQVWQRHGLEGCPVALLHPGSGQFSLARRWPPERFAAVGDRLTREHGLRVTVLAGPAPGESELARRVMDLMSEPSLVLEPAVDALALAALLRRCRLFVGNDSGVMHLAAAVKVPVVAIFGPSNAAAWGPYPPAELRNAVVREALACSPCFHRGHSFGTPAGCPERTCLQVLEPDSVLEAVSRVLAASTDTRVGSRRAG